MNGVDELIEEEALAASKKADDNCTSPEGSTPNETAEANVSTMITEATDDTVIGGCDGAEAAMATHDDDSPDDAAETSPASAGENASVAEASQRADVKASLLDRAQVFWSRSVSTVRSQVPELTQHRVDPTVDVSDTLPETNTTTPSQEMSTQEMTSVEEMSPQEVPAATDEDEYLMVENLTSNTPDVVAAEDMEAVRRQVTETAAAAAATAEAAPDAVDDISTEASAAAAATAAATVEAVEAVGAVQELADEVSTEGSIEPPVACVNIDAATDSASAPEAHHEPSSVNATPLDRAQVCVSLAACALRSQASALIRPNRAIVA